MSTAYAIATWIATHWEVISGISGMLSALFTYLGHSNIDLRKAPMLALIRARVAAILAAHPNVNLVAAEAVAECVQQITADVMAAGPLPTSWAGLIPYLESLNGQKAQIEADFSKLVALLTPPAPATV